ncbi:MAG TPA: hypothetical protein RMH80_14545, partial [Polyangiaceae bacterium LLY-WYZ-15_(1-7)]|nr:hypothetical protein [Polyangiaceae bacterium LLY-WYZ-15_(1-7)]
GAIAGPCFRVAAELDEATPSYFATRLDFMDDAFDDPEERDLLTPGAREILEEGTAGGSSEISEAFAMEVLARCEGATLLQSETEIRYDPMESTRTDMRVSIDGMPVGVSVTRAFRFPPGSPFTTTDAMGLLEDKLGDILVSSANVEPEFDWVKQILVVMAYADMHEESLRTVWDTLDAETRADTIVYVVITDGDDSPVY